jgi:hypothetical protein
LLELSDAAGVSPHLSGARCDVVVAIAGKEAQGESPVAVATRDTGN